MTPHIAQPNVHVTLLLTRNIAFILCKTAYEESYEELTCIAHTKPKCSVKISNGACQIKTEDKSTEQPGPACLIPPCFHTTRCPCCGNREPPWSPSAPSSASSAPPSTRCPWSCVWSAPTQWGRPRPLASSSSRGTGARPLHTAVLSPRPEQDFHFRETSPQHKYNGFRLFASKQNRNFSTQQNCHVIIFS